MNISKTTFKALNRCDRYAGLAEVAKEKTMLSLHLQKMQRLKI